MAFLERRHDHPERIEAHLDVCSDCRRLVANIAAELAARGAVPTASGSVDTLAGAAAARGLSSGDRVARYVVERELGRGGMGIVYRANDPALQRPVALKVVRAEIADSNARQRIMREARAMAKLAHPNVVAIHDVGELPDGEIFLAMELVEGGTLRQLVRREEGNRARIVDLYVQAARGLAAAHEAGLVHRDFKPDNVLVGSDGRARVTDFGLVRGDADGGALGSASVRRGPLTATGSVVGTPAYMAPEQHIGVPASPAADQFALAVALYEALTGTRPFKGRDYDEIMRAKLERARDPWPAVPHVPEMLRAAIDRGLARSPEARHPSMAHFIAELDRGRLGLDRAPAAPSPPLPMVFGPPPIARPLRRAPRDHPLVFIIPIAVGLVLALGLVIDFVHAWVVSDGGRQAGAPKPTSEEATPSKLPALARVLPTPASCPSGTTAAQETNQFFQCVTLTRERSGPALGFYDDGVVSRQETYANDKLEGPSWHFDRSGHPVSMIEYHEGDWDGLYVMFHPNGKIATEDHYRRGKRHGVSRSWTTEGQLRAWRRYEDGVAVARKSF